VAERNSPLFFHEKRLRPGSGGTKFPAPGLEGGADGGLGDVQVNGVSIDNRRQHVLKRGDVVLVRTPGAGGYGPAAQRDPAAAERDRALGY
jgi:N-methylhydantoinase B